jgi:hypothetical protein
MRSVGGAYGAIMQFPFEALDSGAIVVRRPLRRGAPPKREPVRITPDTNPLVAACRDAAASAAQEKWVWIALFLSALVLLWMSFAL